MLHMLQCCTRMLQSFVPNISSAFSDVYCKCAYLMLHMFYIYVASFIWMFYTFCNGFFKCFYVFFASISDVYQVFIHLQKHVVNVFHLDVSKVDRGLRWSPPAAAAGVPPSGHRRLGGESGDETSGVRWCGHSKRNACVEIQTCASIRTSER
jgi:hypothetical protein